MEKSAVASALIALLGGLLGVFIGQKMTATTEADKVVRSKVDEAYFYALSLPSLGQDLHSAVLQPISQANFDYSVSRYGAALSKYREGIARVVAVSDLYEPRLGTATQKLADCADKFTATATDHVLLRVELSGRPIAHSPSYANPNVPLSLTESANATLALRLDCERVAVELKKSIVSAMRFHM